HDLRFWTASRGPGSEPGPPTRLWPGPRPCALDAPLARSRHRLGHTLTNGLIAARLPVFRIYRDALPLAAITSFRGCHESTNHQGAANTTRSGSSYRDACCGH